MAEKKREINGAAATDTLIGLSRIPVEFHRCATAQSLYSPGELLV